MLQNALCGYYPPDLGDYGHLACTSCHEHDRAISDAHHRGVRDYLYLDAECVRCHPRGRVL